MFERNNPYLMSVEFRIPQLTVLMASSLMLAKKSAQLLIMDIRMFKNTATQGLAGGNKVKHGVRMLLDQVLTGSLPA